MVKNCDVCLKRRKLNEKKPRMAHYMAMLLVDCGCNSAAHHASEVMHQISMCDSQTQALA